MGTVDGDYVLDIVFQCSTSDQFGAELAIGPALALAVRSPQNSHLIF
jgi:hypothetical protein